MAEVPLDVSPLLSRLGPLTGFLVSVHAWVASTPTLNGVRGVAVSGDLLWILRLGFLLSRALDDSLYRRRWEHQEVAGLNGDRSLVDDARLANLFVRDHAQI